MYWSFTQGRLSRDMERKSDKSGFLTFASALEEDRQFNPPNSARGGETQMHVSGPFYFYSWFWYALETNRCSEKRVTGSPW